MSQRIAIIDLGSNSARLIIVEVYENRAYNLIYHQKETIRLSQNADKNHQLQPEAMARAMSLLQNFAHVCKLHHVDKIIAVGTAAIRNAHTVLNLCVPSRKKQELLLESLVVKQKPNSVISAQLIL